MKFLVLGSEGQIGGHLCKYLESKGHEVIHFDIVRSKQEDLRKANNKILVEKVKEADFIYFLAFDVGGSKYLLEKSSDNDFIYNNLFIMINTFKIIHQYNKPYVFASSQMASLIFSSYGNLKALGEKLSKNGVVARFWNVYGKEDYGKKSHVITDFIYMALKDKSISMRTSGSERRQFLYADDCSEAMYAIYENYDKLKKGFPYAISNFRWSKISEIAEIVAKKIGDVSIQPGFLLDSVQMGNEVEPMNSDILNIWKPKTSVEDGIEILINYYKELIKG